MWCARTDTEFLRTHRTTQTAIASDPGGLRRCFLHREEALMCPRLRNVRRCANAGCTWRCGHLKASFEAIWTWANLEDPRCVNQVAAAPQIYAGMSAGQNYT